MPVKHVYCLYYIAERSVAAALRKDRIKPGSLSVVGSYLKVELSLTLDISQWIGVTVNYTTILL